MKLSSVGPKKKMGKQTSTKVRAVVVAQLVERSLLIPEVCGLNPVIGKIYIEHLFTDNCVEKMKIKKKKPGMAHFLTKGGFWYSFKGRGK